MNNELAPFYETAIQTAFDWDATVAEIKALIVEDNALGKQEEEIRERRYAIRIQIGFNLIALQQEHSNRKNGDFIAFAEREFGYKSKATIYEHIQVADRLGNYKVRHGVPYNWSTARELARPSTSDTIIEQVLEGSIEATPEAIKQARKEEAEAKQRAKELEEDNQKLQGKLDIFEKEKEKELSALESERDSLEQKILNREKEDEDLAQQIRSNEEELTRLREGLETKSEPEQIEVEVEKLVTPPEVVAEIEAMKERIASLEEEQKKLQEESNAKADELASLSQERDKLVKDNEGLTKLANDNLFAETQAKYESEVKDGNKKMSHAFNTGVHNTLAFLPSAIDAKQAYGSDEWSRVAQMKSQALQFIEKLDKLKDEVTSQFVDTHPMLDAPIAYIESPMSYTGDRHG
jgi:hypothetical protein